MKYVFSIIIAINCLSFFSCRNSHAFDKYVKELDSLKVVLEQSVDNFKTVDSLTCINAYSKQYTYSQFIETHLKDTVTKSVAENLQNFQSIKRGLLNYLTFRSSWLANAYASIRQLQTLSHDLKSGSLSQDEAVGYIATEKQKAETIIEELKVNTETIRNYLEVYNRSLPTCENLVKELNSGILPKLITPQLNTNR
jgi:hypothetical protein